MGSPPVVKKKEDSTRASGASWRDKNPAPPEPVKVFREVSVRSPPVAKKEDDPSASGPSRRAKEPAPPESIREFPSRRTVFEKEDPPRRQRPSVNERTKKADEPPSGKFNIISFSPVYGANTPKNLQCQLAYQKGPRVCRG